MPLFTRSAARRGGQEPEDVPGYRNLRPIGHGGFSVVYRAHQEALNREVALKVVTVPLDDDVRRRFLREVMLTGRLTGHPNVVGTLDAGLTAAGRPYLAMDLHDGGSLLDRLSTQGPLPAAEVARIGAKIAGALAAAHSLGIVHRDVKPSNILLSRFGEPVLTDFGVACLLDDRTSATVLGTFTLRHAAPEVVNGAQPDAASDVYALGSTMYELLTGRPAFDGRGMETLALMRRILTEEPAPITCPDLPELAGVVARTMAKNPQDRYRDAAALASALARLAPGSDPVAVAPAVPSVPGTPGVAGVPGTPGVVDAPDAPDAPDENDTPVLSGTPAHAATWDPVAQWDRLAWSEEQAESGRLPRTIPLPPEETPGAPVPGSPGDFAVTALRPGRIGPVAEPPPVRARRTRTALLAALGVVVVVGGGTGVVAQRHGSDSPAGQIRSAAASPGGAPSASTGPTPHASGTRHAAASPVAGRHPGGGPAAPPATGGSAGQPAGPGPAPTGANPPATGNPAPTTAAPRPTGPAPTTAPRTTPPPPTVCTTGGCAGKAYFVANGEHLFVCDETPDGYGAIARYTRTDVPGQNNVAADKNGAGTCIDHNMNMPEGAHITFSVCLIDKAGALSRCSPWITTTA